MDKGPQQKTEPINVAIDLDLMQRDGADLERHNSWVNSHYFCVERQGRLTSLVNKSLANCHSIV